jgi:hypothetical protein
MVVAWIIVLPILKGVKLDYGDPSIITGVIAGPVPGILGEEIKAPPLLSLAGTPDWGDARKKASPSPVPLPMPMTLPSQDMLKEKVVVKLAILPLALSHSGTGSAYWTRPTLFRASWSYTRI